MIAATQCLLIYACSLCAGTVCFFKGERIVAWALIRVAYQLLETSRSPKRLGTWGRWGVGRQQREVTSGQNLNVMLTPFQKLPKWFCHSFFWWFLVCCHFHVSPRIDIMPSSHSGSSSHQSSSSVRQQDLGMGISCPSGQLGSLALTHNLHWCSLCGEPAWRSG